MRYRRARLIEELADDAALRGKPEHREIVARLHVDPHAGHPGQMLARVSTGLVPDDAPADLLARSCGHAIERETAQRVGRHQRLAATDNGTRHRIAIGKLHHALDRGPGLQDDVGRGDHSVHGGQWPAGTLALAI